MDAIQPAFIFSLPRSGSTMVQRVLASHPGVATVAEPWVLLPLLGADVPNLMFSKYNHRNYRRALHDFIASVDGGRDRFDRMQREYARKLYEAASAQGAEVFIDKTPRYSLIAEQIVDIFPEGKFIFLWRNPLAIAASMIETWGSGKWILYRYKVDLFLGLETLTACQQNTERDIYSVRYEDLVRDPSKFWPKLFRYMGLEFDSRFLSDFADVTFQGDFGDPTGTKRYASVTTDSLEKWKKVLGNPIRKRWGRRYLRWIGKERLASMGYDLDRLLAELTEIPLGLENVIWDLIRVPYGALVNILEPEILREKLRHGGEWEYQVTHR